VLGEEENRTAVPFHGNGKRAILWSSGEPQKYRKRLRREINMGNGVKRTILVVLALISFVSILPIAARTQTIAPRLLWEKTTPFEIGSIEMARQSGDVIISSRGARQIILYDKDGNKRFHWGPRIDRQPMGIDISYDGNIVAYTTIWTEEYTEKKRIDTNKLGWDARVHYSTKTGKELWNRQIQGSAFLSPDGSLVAVVGEYGIGGVPLTVLDSKGNVLWKYPSRPVLDLRFSPDGSYILFYDGDLHLFDKSGNLLWKKTDALEADSVSEGATYITTRDKKVYDKQGNVVFEGDAEASGDGKRLLVSYSDRMSMLSLPDKTVIKDYTFWGKFLSYEGRFLVTHSFSQGQVGVFDTLLESWGRINIGNRNFLVHGNTKDGKYLVVGAGDNRLLYYQVYQR